MGFHARAWAASVRVIVRPDSPRSRALALETLLFPMEAVRYFEFGTAWSWVAESPGPLRFLDVSSPRLFPLLLLRHREDSEGDLMNPDPGDLAITSDWVNALAIDSRCTLHASTVGDAALPPGAFDLVTSISVLEHIPEPHDLEALDRMWTCIRPGGRLVLTVPCAQEAFEEYVDLNEYGLLVPDDEGFVFGQRFYDEITLRERVFARIGTPRRSAVLGERVRGTAFADRDLKLLGRANLAREPLSAAADYAHFPSPDALPGVGVIALEFEKPAGA
jgi:SAM-dependent methyltransferase